MTYLPNSGMCRVSDHATSEAAAAKVSQRKPTIRALVLIYAQQASNGFIDDDLRVIDPDAPESSLRKRRSELTDDNLILDSGRTRHNKHGLESKVWIHRKFHPNPPPEKIKVRGSRAEAMQRRKREAIMWNALVECAYRFVFSHSDAARATAEALGTDFPIRVTEIPAKRPL